MRHTHTGPFFVCAAAAAVWLAQSPVALAQQPLITTVSGSPTQGAVLTISGSNLHAETMQNWDNYFYRFPNAWSFEGTSPTADGYQAGGGPTGVYDPTFKLLGNQSIKFHSVSQSSCTAADGSFLGGLGQSYNALFLDDPSSNSEYWVRVYVSYNRVGAWPSQLVKMFEAMLMPYYFQPSGAPAGSNAQSWDNIYSSTSHYVPNPGGQIQNRRWYAVELHWRHGSAPLFESWVDGVQLHSGVPTPLSVSTGLRTILFGVINACGTSAWDLEHWMDGLVVAHQRVYPSAIVEVGNGSNYATATRKVQAVKSIADDQISFTLDTSGLGSGPYYVWVRNNAQQLSAGYFLASGQSSGLAAPANLRIIP